MLDIMSFINTALMAVGSSLNHAFHFEPIANSTDTTFALRITSLVLLILYLMGSFRGLAKLYGLAALLILSTIISAEHQSPASLFNTVSSTWHALLGNIPESPPPVIRPDWINFVASLLDHKYLGLAKHHFLEIADEVLLHVEQPENVFTPRVQVEICVLMVKEWAIRSTCVAFLCLASSHAQHVTLELKWISASMERINEQRSPFTHLLHSSAKFAVRNPFSILRSWTKTLLLEAVNPLIQSEIRKFQEGMKARTVGHMQEIINTQLEQTIRASLTEHFKALTPQMDTFVTNTIRESLNEFGDSLQNSLRTVLDEQLAEMRTTGQDFTMRVFNQNIDATTSWVDHRAQELAHIIQTRASDQLIEVAEKLNESILMQRRDFERFVKDRDLQGTTIECFLDSLRQHLPSEAMSYDDIEEMVTESMAKHTNA